MGLAISDGDLVLSGSALLTISGPSRIKQDLTIALRDQYGADPNHPYWGSILDRYIGLPLNDSQQAQVVAEVQRVLNNYVAVQADMVNSAVVNSVKGTLDTSDVIRSVVAIDTTVTMDQILIQVTLQTMSGDSVTVTRSVSV